MTRAQRLSHGVAAATLALCAGCMFQTVREQQAKADAVGTLAGTVRTEHASTRPLLVVLLARDGDRTWVADHFVLEKPGRWLFRAMPGTYALGAFEDVNGNLRYDADEPALYPRETDYFRFGAGEQRLDLALRIPTSGRAPATARRDIESVGGRSTAEQVRVTLGSMLVVGEVAQLSDPRFAPENGTKGMWAPFDFMAEVGPGVYFAEPYDPKKTPVLFVHGITGTPRNFVELARRLDGTRFQPWFFYYPSGAFLDNVADAMGGLITRLHVQYRFRELYVVAHSMGGLVARAALLRHAVAGGDYVTRFVSIATPWAGHPGAQRGVEEAPAVVRSWLAMAPESAFLEALFYEDAGSGRARRRLPSHLRYDLVFAYRRPVRRFGESSDSVITLASQLRPEAQDEATLTRGFDDTHVTVLDNPETAALLNVLLR